MRKLFEKFTSTVKFSSYLLSMMSISSLTVAPANAQQAVVRSAVTIVRPSGSYQSLSGEVSLPEGMYFNAGDNPTLTITPTFTNPGTTSESIQSLSISAGTPASITTINANSSVSATGQVPVIQNITQIEDAATLIQVGNGVSNSGALE